MDDYIIRKAIKSDISFLANAIIAAEKGNTSTLAFSNLFDLTEEVITKLIILMLEEEIDGCEFSLSSFFVAEYNGIPVAACGGWLEGYFNGMSSTILKANLINFTFPKESLFKCQKKNDLIKDLKIIRDFCAYQIEYAYVDSKHRGKKLMQTLLGKHLKYALELNPDIKKVQAFPFENNLIIIKINKNVGFTLVKKYESVNSDILKYSPYSVRLLMEKYF